MDAFQIPCRQCRTGSIIAGVVLLTLDLNAFIVDIDPGAALTLPLALLPCESPNAPIEPREHPDQKASGCSIIAALRTTPRQRRCDVKASAEFRYYLLCDEATEVKGLNVMASAWAWQPNSKTLPSSPV